MASAPGKLILLGEYAVLEGSPAMVTAVHRRAEVCLDVSDGHGVWLFAPEIGLQGVELTASDGQLISSDNRLAFVGACLDDVWARYPALAGRRLEIRISSERFLSSDGGPKLGLGSSAAVSVALLTALEVAARSGQGPSIPQVFEAAHRAHRRAQGGVGSGLDVAASSFGGVVEMSPGAEGQVQCRGVELPVGVSILPVYTGRGASTTELVGVVQAYAQKDALGYRDLIKSLTETAKSAGAAVSAREFLECCARYGRGLDALGKASGADIFSDVHQALARVATDEGFVYKPSGAGGGDIGLVFGDDANRLENMRNKLKSVGGEPLELDLGAPGVIFTLG